MQTFKQILTTRWINLALEDQFDVREGWLRTRRITQVEVHPGCYHLWGVSRRTGWAEQALPHPYYMVKDIARAAPLHVTLEIERCLGAFKAEADYGAHYGVDEIVVRQPVNQEP